MKAFDIPPDSSPAQIATRAASAAIPYIGIKGVYFLFCDDELAYIGQSVNIFARIAAHKTRVKFNRVAWTVIEDDAERERIEAELIAALLPRFNAPPDFRSRPRPPHTRVRRKAEPRVEL